MASSGAAKPVEKELRRGALAREIVLVAAFAPDCTADADAPEHPAMQSAVLLGVYTTIEIINKLARAPKEIDWRPSPLFNFLALRAGRL